MADSHRPTLNKKNQRAIVGGEQGVKRGLEGCLIVQQKTPFKKDKGSARMTETGGGEGREVD